MLATVHILTVGDVDVHLVHEQFIIWFLIFLALLSRG